MSRRPLCITALVYIIAIIILLLIDTSGIVKTPLSLRESTAAGLIKQKQQINVSGNVYKQEVKNNQLILYLNHSNLIQDSNSIKANDIIIYANLKTQIQIGNYIQVTGKAKKFQKPTNPGQFNSYLYYKSLNIDFGVKAQEIQILQSKTNILKSALLQLRNRLASNFDQITKEDTENGTFQAMVLGDKSEFTGDIKDLYQKGGILHAFCISGLHIGMIGMFLFHIFRRIGFGYKISGGVGISIVICYGMMTGFGVSALRAVIMFVIVMMAKMLGRTYDMLSSLALAVILVLMDNPLYIVNIGFLLSFGAVLGISTVYPVLSQGLSLKSYIGKALLSSLSITLVTFPIILYSYYEFPIYSILLNLIIIPIMGYVLISGILGCLCAEFSPLLGSFMLGMGSYILKLYEMSCKLTMRLPFSSIIIGRPSRLQIVLYYVILILMLYIISKAKKRRYAGMLIIMVVVLVFRFPHGFKITILDVGQGDGIVIQSEEGSTYMIDGGSTDVTSVGKYRILPFLKSQGIKKLDYCILTHPDEDHKSGLEEIIQSDYEIDHLIMPQISMEDEAYDSLEQLAKQTGIPIIYISKGNRMKEGALELKCLHPYKEYIPESRNDYSTVLSLTYKKFHMLFTGDVEAKGEKELMKYLKEDYDVLKVAHHGSKNSTSKEFLNKLKAEYAVISCGENNRYGHPHKELLERLQEKNMKILTTVDGGAIMIQVTDDWFEYSCYR